MKKVFFICAFFVLVFPILQSQDFTVGTDDWPPYEYKVNNEVTGFSVKILQAVFKQINGTIKNISLFTWFDLEKKARDGVIDVILSLSKSIEREKYFYFPEEALITTKWLYVIRNTDKQKISFKTLTDLKNLKFGVVRNYSYTEELWDFLQSTKQFEEMPEDEGNLKKLINKRIDITIVEEHTGIQIAKKLGILNDIYFLETPLKTSDLFVAFSKKTVSLEFVKKFSEALKQFKKTKEFQTLENEYFKSK